MASSHADSDGERMGRAFFDTLSREQRRTLAGVHDLTDEERTAFLVFLTSESFNYRAPAPTVAGRKRPASAAAVEGPRGKRSLNEGTGPAFVAFARRAVELEYMSSNEHERVSERLYALPDELREEACVRAMRRFIAGMQPLGDNVVLVDCPTRHKSHPDLDLNGIRGRCEGLPGGTPERYNVTIPCVEGDKGTLRGLRLNESDEKATVLLEAEIEPRYIRPAPGKHESRDEEAHPIPEDQAADAWFEKEVALYEKNLPLLLALGSQGAMRPT